MKVRVSDLSGPALDWAVAKCEGVDITHYGGGLWYGDSIESKSYEWCPSGLWAQGGPIVERESITLRTNAGVTGHWAAFIDFGGSCTNVSSRQSGPTPLIAAMRCYVTSKMGDVIEVPDELI